MLPLLYIQWRTSSASQTYLAQVRDLKEERCGSALEEVRLLSQILSRPLQVHRLRIHTHTEELHDLPMPLTFLKMLSSHFILLGL